ISAQVVAASFGKDILSGVYVLATPITIANPAANPTMPPIAAPTAAPGGPAGAPAKPPTTAPTIPSRKAVAPPQRATSTLSGSTSIEPVVTNELGFPGVFAVSNLNSTLTPAAMSVPLALHAPNALPSKL